MSPGRLRAGLGAAKDDVLFGEPAPGRMSEGTEGTTAVDLLVFSDLHLEHKPRWQLPEEFPHFDVCLAAGDIDGSPAASIRRLAANPALESKPIVFVAGNHEFYGNVLEDAIEAGRAAAAETGVHFLNMNSATIGGVRFVGATLWTDFDLFGCRPVSMGDAARGMTDYRTIKRRAITPGHPGKFRVAPKETAWHHDRHLAYIDSVLSRPFDGPTVVVTHHAPSARSVPSNLRNDPLSAAYASNLDGLIERQRPALWVHGHMHNSVDYRIGETRIRSNPKGYGPGGRLEPIENPAFDPHFTVRIPLVSAALAISGEQS